MQNSLMAFFVVAAFKKLPHRIFELGALISKR